MVAVGINSPRNQRMLNNILLYRLNVKVISKNSYTTLLVFLSVFGVVETLNIAGLAWVPRLEDEQKYGIIWYKSICQALKHTSNTQTVHFVVNF